MVDLRAHDSSSSSFHFFPKDSQNLLTVITSGSATSARKQDLRTIEAHEPVTSERYMNTIVKSIQAQTCFLWLSPGKWSKKEVS